MVMFVAAPVALDAERDAPNANITSDGDVARIRDVEQNTTAVIRRDIEALTSEVRALRGQVESLRQPDPHAEPVE